MISNTYRIMSTLYDAKQANRKRKEAIRKSAYLAKMNRIRLLKLV